MKPIPPRIAYPLGFSLLGGNAALIYEGAVRGHGAAAALVAALGVVGALLLLVSTYFVELALRAGGGGGK